MGKMRVHVLQEVRNRGTLFTGYSSKGDYEVLAETDKFYKIKDSCLESCCSWIPKERCEIIRKPKEERDE